MSDVNMLVALQQIDTELEVTTKRLQEIEIQLEGSPELISARDSLQETQDQMRILQTHQQSLETDAVTAKDRIQALEARMMGGEVTNPRELPTIQLEVEKLSLRRGQLEEQALSALDEVEKERPELDTRKSQVKTLEEQWAGTQTALIREKDRLERELPGLHRKRAEKAKTVAPWPFKVYERVRAKKGGKAVALIERGICSGCRISLPTTLIQRARAGREIVSCSSCGRILYSA